MRYRVPVILVIITSAFLFSCRKGFELASWDVEVYAPLATGTVNFADYLPDELNNTSNGYQLNLIASDTLVRLGLDTLIAIPDTTTRDTFFLPVTVNVPAGTILYTNQKKRYYKIKDVQLTQAIIRESEIQLNIKNSLNKPVQFTYKILNATDANNNPFETVESVGANATLTKSYAMNGYTLDLRGIDQKSFNTIVSEVTVKLDSSLTGTVQVNPGQILISSTVKNIGPEFVKGYFGSETTTFNQTEPISLFDQIDFERLDINQFDVTMTIDNGFGVDLMLNIAQLGARNTAKGTSASLHHSAIGSDQLFTRAINLYNPADPVKHIQKQYVFNEQNSNLDELLEIKPNEVFADITLAMNPLGNISLGNDFIYYGHDLSAFMDLRVPLIVSAKGVSLEDTAEFTFSDYKRLDQVNGGELIIYLDNYYPLEANVQMTLLDSMDAVLDSLFSSSVKIEGALELNSFVKDPATTEVRLPVDQDLFEKMRDTRKVIVYVNINTTGTSAIHIRQNSRVDFKMVADLNVRTK